MALGVCSAFHPQRAESSQIRFHLEDSKAGDETAGGFYLPSNALLLLRAELMRAICFSIQFLSFTNIKHTLPFAQHPLRTDRVPGPVPGRAFIPVAVVKAPPSLEDRCWDSALTAEGAEAPRRERCPHDPSGDSGQVCRAPRAEHGAPGSADPSVQAAPEHRPWAGGSRRCVASHPSQMLGMLHPVVCVTS